MDKINFEQYFENIPKPQLNSEENLDQDFNTDDIWKIVTENLKMILDRVEYDSWFDGTYLEKIQNGVAVISCSNEFKRQTILRDYNKFLQSCLTKATGQNLQVEITVKTDNTKTERYKFVKEDNQTTNLFSGIEGEKRKYEEASKNANLNPRYTFDTFIIGASNRLAEAVAQSIVSDIESGGGAKTYNPVFYYGKSGVGKTHLMQAIGNEVIKKDPSKKVVYTPIEQFLNEMIETIRTKKNEDFRNKYRRVDLLIIDDLGTECVNNMKFTELFNIINTRLLNQKNITKTIISTNLSLQNLYNTYDERIVSRIIGDYNICYFFGEDIRFKKICD